MVKKHSYSMLECVKCGHRHKIMDDYNKCDKCNCNQFHIVKCNNNIVTNKNGEIELSMPTLYTILVILLIVYFTIRILKLLGFM